MIVTIAVCLIILATLTVLGMFFIAFEKSKQKKTVLKEIHEMLQVSKDIDKRVIHVENRMEEYAKEITMLKNEIKRLKSKKQKDNK